MKYQVYEISFVWNIILVKYHSSKISFAKNIIRVKYHSYKISIVLAYQSSQMASGRTFLNLVDFLSDVMVGSDIRVCVQGYFYRPLLQSTTLFFEKAAKKT